MPQTAESYDRDQSISRDIVINPLVRLDRVENRTLPPFSDNSRLESVRAFLERLGRARLLIALDLAAVAVIAATFAQVEPPELLFHVAFVILVVEAFIFGRRICLQRIGAVSIALIAYALLPSLGAGTVPLELTEWPLMFAIAVLVAWMADREQNVGRRYAALYRETREQLVRAQEEERGRIARDLHDGVAQTLTALALTLDSTEGRDLAGSRPAIERSRELAREALADTRLAAERIRPPRLAEYGLTGALRSLASPRGGRITIDIDPAAEIRLAADAELDAYRIAEEAIRNALRHSSARQIAVTLDRVDDRLRLMVVDDGVGFQRDQIDIHRLGLVGMAERAAALGGVLKVDSTVGQGTRVVLTVPITSDGAPS
jgi:signal transduction histidine kinase